MYRVLYFGMYHVTTQGVGECMINVHYYFYVPDVYR